MSAALRGLRLAPGRRVFLLEDGRAAMLEGGPCVMHAVVAGLQGAALSESDTPLLRCLPERLGWDCTPYGPQALNPWPFPG